MYSDDSCAACFIADAEDRAPTMTSFGVQFMKKSASYYTNQLTMKCWPFEIYILQVWTTDIPLTWIAAYHYAWFLRDLGNFLHSNLREAIKL